MDHEYPDFGQFFASRLKDKNTSLKKIADITGIAPAHIEALLRNDFEEMPSAPYLRGYLIRLGNALDFNGEEWWMKLKQGGLAKNSGELDALPENRFTKQSPPKFLWAVAAGVAILIYLAIQLPHISGTPSLVIAFPAESPYTTTDSTLTLRGTVGNADSLTINGDDIMISSDGSWQKQVLLGTTNPNTFKLTAKKTLGGETSIIEEIIYAPAASASSPTSTLPVTPTGTTSGSPKPTPTLTPTPIPGSGSGR